jgi:inner membrane protein
MSGIWVWLQSLGGWNWLILGALLLVLEALLPGMHIVWFALSAFVVGALALTIGLAWQSQVLAFVVITVATLILVRWLVARTGHSSDQPHLNERAGHYVGQTFEVAEAIAGGRGRIKVGDSLWQAEGPDVPAGARVRVTGARGTVLVVENAGSA